MLPLTAIVAVTYRCNARCKMCDIWKKQASKSAELPADGYAALPDSLQDINITGGEPFLRDDLIDIIRTIKQSCPKARIVISTNGLLVDRIKASASGILKLEPDVAIRVSIDSLGANHDGIRGVPHAFKKATESTQFLKQAGIKDLGIAMTLMGENEGQVLDVYRYAQELAVDFSITLVSNSDIYFGSAKSDLRPISLDQLQTIATTEYLGWSPRHWFRGWFAESLKQYAATSKRQLSCDAGYGFFYLDPAANIYACHIKSALMGNLKEQGFKDIWDSTRAREARDTLLSCEDCWMVCTCKSEIFKRRRQIGYSLIKNKLRHTYKKIGAK